MSAAELFPAGARVVFLHAHPDDETLASGVLIAGLVASGHSVAVLTATRGERGEVRPGVDVGADLVAHREAELVGALAELGVADHCFLGSPPARAGSSTPARFTDSGMRWLTPELAGPAADAGSDSLTAAGLDVPAADLTAFLRAYRADLLVSYDVHGGYGHPDHVACHAIAHRAAAAAAVTLWEVVSESALPSPDAVAYSAPEQLPAVRRALACYPSQLRLDGDAVVLVGGQRQPIVSTVWLRRSSRSGDRPPKSPSRH